MRTGLTANKNDINDPIGLIFIAPTRLALENHNKEVRRNRSERLFVNSILIVTFDFLYHFRVVLARKR